MGRFTLGHIAFGNGAPGNILTDDHSLCNLYLLIILANLCMIIHLVGAYQVFTQPVFALIESWTMTRWSHVQFITGERVVHIPLVGLSIRFSVFRMVWRTSYVVLTSVMAMIFPFFNAILGLPGAIAFWPLTIYFPVEMYIVQARISRFSFTWIWLQIPSFFCLVISVLAAVRSICHAL